MPVGTCFTDAFDDPETSTLRHSNRVLCVWVEFLHVGHERRRVLLGNQIHGNGICDWQTLGVAFSVCAWKNRKTIQPFTNTAGNVYIDRDSVWRSCICRGRIRIRARRDRVDVCRPCKYKFGVCHLGEISIAFGHVVFGCWFGNRLPCHVCGHSSRSRRSTRTL